LTPDLRLNSSPLSRLAVSLIAAILPFVLLAKGVYGSFIFTFSIPIVWQFGIRGYSLKTLGLRWRLVKPSVIIGILSGCLLAFAGGSMLRLSGIGGRLFTGMQSLEYSVLGMKIAFPLHKELGYRILSADNGLVNTGVYLLFNLLVIGAGEEIFWRGFIQKKISHYLSANLAILLTALLFALIHFYIFTILSVWQGTTFLFLILISGLVWGYLFKYFDNILASAISHGITAFIIWKFYFFNLN
jgi:membrane protease YdiL (CAAX protease family)